MDIFYDGAIYSIQKFGGINRYFKNLIDHLPDDMSSTLVATCSPEGLPTRAKCLVRKAPKATSWFKPLRKSIEAKKCRRTLQAVAPRIVHPTYYWSLTRSSYDEQKRYPVVLTVHDFIHERFHKSIRHSGKQIEWKKQAIERSDAIICVSHSTLEDLSHFYPSAVAKARVIHLADELSNTSNERGPDPEIATCRESDNYFLYVGGRENYKNFSALLKSFRIVVAANSELRMVCVGSAFTDVEQSLIAELHLSENVENLGRVSDARLVELYEQSIAFVYPSLYEGFGIPLLEAMGCDTVVLASNRSSFPEVIGDAGILFDPTDEQDMASAMLTVADNSDLRRELQAKGKAQHAKFSWERVAESTADVYRRVA